MTCYKCLKYAELNVTMTVLSSDPRDAHVTEMQACQQCAKDDFDKWGRNENILFTYDKIQPKPDEV